MHMHSNRHHHLLITSSFKSRQNVHYRNTIAKETGSSFQQTFQLLRGTHLVNPIGFCSLLLFFFCLPKSQIDSSRLYLAAHLHITSLEQESCHRIVSFAVRICVLPCNSFHVILSQFFFIMLFYWSSVHRQLYMYFLYIMNNLWKVFVAFEVCLIVRLAVVLSECHSCICITTNSKQQKQPSAICVSKNAKQTKNIWQNAKITIFRV